MRRRTRSVLAAAAVLLVAAGAAACGQARREYREEFSDPDRAPWAQEQTDSAIREYAEGRYRISVTRGGERELSSRALPEPLRGMRVEVDLIEERGRGELTLYGLVCGAAPATRYYVAVNRRGPFVIEKTRGEGSAEPLADSRISRRFGTQGSAVRLAAECRVEGADVSLTLEVDGRRITGARDENAGVEGFDRVSLFVLTPNSGTVIEFDNLAVLEL